MVQVSVKNIELKDGLTAKWIGLGEDEGMTKPQVAKLLGVTTQSLSLTARIHGFSFVSLPYESRDELIKSNVISLKGRTPKFVTRDVVDALVKIVNTPEAWTRYHEILESLRDPAKLVQFQKEAFGEERLFQIRDEIKKCIQEELKLIRILFSKII